MKVLFDVNMPRPLRLELPGHEIITAQTMGWDRLVNGDLLAAAEQNGFEAMVTADKNLSYQQNLSNRTIAIVVLPSNKLRVLKQIAPAIRAALTSIKPGDYIELTA